MQCPVSTDQLWEDELEMEMYIDGGGGGGKLGG